MILREIVRSSWVESGALLGGFLGFCQFVYVALKLTLRRFFPENLGSQSNHNSDPFLKYYSMAGFWSVFWVWIPMRFCENDEAKLVLVLLEFFFRGYPLR